MKKFEYKTLNVNMFGKYKTDLEDELNYLGSQGWELVASLIEESESNSSITKHVHTNHRLIFKREKNECR